ncbi:MAG: FG-GAP-like repeat-containing protein [Bdellovibrionales bacterium]
MGFTPQVVDFDGDGNPDILSGSWPGELYLFTGLGKGKFGKAEILTDKDGKEIKLGSASTVFAVDYFHKGKLDLLVGCIEGNVWLVANEGSRRKPAYGKAIKLKATGEEIKANHGDSHPIAVDWDGDGKLDLLLGTGAGSVLFHRNLGTKAEPKFAKGNILVPESPRSGNYQKTPGPLDHGMRAKIAVADFNGDGKQDLLLGDFDYFMGEEPKLTEADGKAKAEAQKKYNEILKDYQPFSQRMAKILPGNKKETAEEKADRQKKMAELQKEMEPVMKRLQEASRAMARFNRPMEYRGRVWVFLRQELARSKQKD